MYRYKKITKKINIMRKDLTFSYIKPGAQKFFDEIFEIIEQAGFRIIGIKHYAFSRDEAIKLYEHLKEKSFFETLIEYTCSEPVIFMILQKENAIESFRKIIGATNPANAEEGTIRKLYGIPNSGHLNAIHGSDSNENAKKEIELFFEEFEYS